MCMVGLRVLFCAEVGGTAAQWAGLGLEEEEAEEEEEEEADEQVEDEEQGGVLRETLAYQPPLVPPTRAYAHKNAYAHTHTTHTCTHTHTRMHTRRHIHIHHSLTHTHTHILTLSLQTYTHTSRTVSYVWDDMATRERRLPSRTSRGGPMQQFAHVPSPWVCAAIVIVS